MLLLQIAHKQTIAKYNKKKDDKNSNNVERSSKESNQAVFLSYVW